MRDIGLAQVSRLMEGRKSPFIRRLGQVQVEFHPGLSFNSAARKTFCFS